MTWASWDYHVGYVVPLMKRSKGLELGPDEQERLNLWQKGREIKTEPGR
jgi:hypothetical protein